MVEDGVAEKVKLEDVMNALLAIAAVEGSDDNTRNARQHAYFCMQIVRLLPFFSFYPNVCFLLADFTNILNQIRSKVEIRIMTFIG